MRADLFARLIQPGPLGAGRPEESDIRRAEDFEGKIVATELETVTRQYFAAKGVNVTVEFSWGTTEIKARLLDGIVELTETGSSLCANNLRIVDTLLTSTPRLIANKAAWEIPWSARRWKTSPCSSAGRSRPGPRSG